MKESTTTWEMISGKSRIFIQSKKKEHFQKEVRFWWEF